MIARYVVLAALVTALTLVAVGCGGGDQSGEDADNADNSDGQYEAGGATVPPPGTTAATGTPISEEDCLQEASESDELSIEVSDPGRVLPYEVVEENDVDPGKDLEVVTEATSREELKNVTEKLRYENRDSDALAIDFYNESGGERQDAGLALVFNTRDAACRAFQYTVENQNELASESNGVSIISIEEGV